MTTTTGLKPSRDLPDSGECAHCGAPIFEGGPPSPGEFPLQCECGYATSLMDLGFYDSTDEEAEDTQDDILTDLEGRLVATTEAIAKARVDAEEVATAAEVVTLEASQAAAEIVEKAEKRAGEIITAADARAAEIIVDAEAKAAALIAEASNDNNGTETPEGEPTPAAGSVSSEQS